MTLFKDRLARALERWGGTKLAFAAEMRARGVRGSSYRSLKNYLKGPNRPSKMWMAEASEVLEVSLDWLRLGEGHMQRVNAPLNNDSPLTWDEVFHASLPPLMARAIEQQAPTVKRSFLVACQALGLSAQRDQDHALTREEQLAIGKRTGVPVQFTLKWIGSDNRDDWDPTVFAVSLGMMWDAIALAAPKPGTGLPLEQMTKEAADA